MKYHYANGLFLLKFETIELTERKRQNSISTCWITETVFTMLNNIYEGNHLKKIWRLSLILFFFQGSKGAELETASEQKTSTPIKNSEQDGESLENRSTPSPGTPRYGPVGMDGESESSQQHVSVYHTVFFSF